MSIAGSQSAVLPATAAAAAASPGNLLEIQILVLHPSPPESETPVEWPQEANKFLTNFQVILMQRKFGKHRSRPQASHYQITPAILCCYPWGKRKDTLMQGQWSLGPDSVGDVGGRLSLEACL